MQRAADFLCHTHVTKRVGVANIAIPCIKLGGKKKLFHQSAEDDLVFFGTDKNLSCISKAGFALDAYASANTIGTLWNKCMNNLGNGSC